MTPTTNPDASPPREIPRAQEQLFDRGVSARDKYADLVVGERGLGPLLRYELITLASQWIPGAAGLTLRQMLYPLMLGACGRGVVFGQHVTLRHPRKVAIDRDVVIDDHCLLDAKGRGNAGIRIGRGVFVGRNTILSCKNGDITIGDGVNIGFNCEIFSASRVTIGPNVLMAAYAYLIGGDHDFSDPGSPVLEQGRVSRGIEIGEGAWIGAGAKVLDGVVIGAHAIVGAGAVVRQAVPAYSVAVGVPARIVSQRRPAAGGGA